MKKSKRIISAVLCIILSFSIFCIPVSASASYTSRSDFLWGVNIHPTSYPDYSLDPELYVKAAAELGVKVLRVNIGNNMYDFSYTDRIVALCSSYGLKVMACVTLSDDLDYNRSYYEALAKRYDGKSGYGYIDYYEIGGEEEVKLLLNKYPVNGPAGDSIDHYYMSDILTLMSKYESAVEGVRNSGTSAETVIDFSHLHYAPLLYMYQNGLDFDVIGIDWYTNMGDINQVLEPVLSKFPHDVIITETNLWSSENTDFENLSEYSLLFDFMDKAYSRDRVKGLIFYELMDEPVFETQNGVSFHTESHFGLLYSLSETSVSPKPIYTYLQSVLGGGSVIPEPVTDRYARTVLDVEGTHLTFADTPGWFYYYLGDRHKKENLRPADFSDCEYIEFDIKIGDIEAFGEVLSSKGLSMWIRFSSGENIYGNSSAANITLNDLAETGNNWYHVKLPVSGFTRNENGAADWSGIKNWQFFLEGNNTDMIGDMYSMEFYFRNICGTASVPDMPENAIAVLDKEGCFNVLGANYIDAYARFSKVGFEGVNAENADFFEFDIQFSDYEKLISGIERTGVRLDFSVTSSSGYWSERWVAANIFDYSSYSGYGWYHVKIPKSVFYNSGGGGIIDWSDIDTWLMSFEFSSGIAAGESCGITMNIKNICVTAAYAVGFPSNGIQIDSEGLTNTVGAAYNYLWDRLNKTVSSVDLSKADYIEFDINYSDYSAFKAAADSTEYIFCFNLTSSGNQWNERVFTESIFDYETSVTGGWHHYKIPKSEFYGTTDWSGINLWMFGFNGAPLDPLHYTGEAGNISLTVRNICGTVYRLKSDKYTVSDGFIAVEAGTDVSELSSAFAGSAEIFSGGISIHSGIVFTGMEIKITDGSNIYDSAQIAVKNDIYADGYINSADLVMLKRYFFGASELTPVQKFALCRKIAAEPDIRNYIQIKKEILNNLK